MTYKRKAGRSALERIILRSELTPCPDPSLEGDCWVWTGALRKGYGSLKVDGKVRYTHQITYEELRGPLPPGEPDHLCKVTACCNPFHLKYGTHGDNMRTRYGGTATHCPRGHERSVYGVRPQTGECAECARERNRERRARKKASMNTNHAGLGQPN